jgi:hypothetical protein
MAYNQQRYSQQKPGPKSKVQYEIGQYNHENSILLTPDIKFEAASGLYSPVVEAVTISLDEADKEVYKKSNKYRLHAKALERIGVAANVVWDVANCGPIHYIPGKECTYRAAGGIQKADGKIEMIAQYFEYNMDVVRDDLQEQYKNDNQKEYKVDRDFRQKRKFMVPYCESMARARVIRKLLNIKQEYTAAELAKPFIMVRFRIEIDYNDPEIKMLAAKAHIMSSVGIFGQPPQQALPSPAAPVVLPHEAATLEDDPAEPDPPQPEPAAETDSTPPKPGQQMTKSFFKDLQRKDQVSELERLIKVKGYDKKRLGMPIKEFPEQHILGFFDALSAMPDQQQQPY